MTCWTIELTQSAQKELKRLDKTVQKRVVRYLYERVAPDPRLHGTPLLGDKSGLWRYRVGDYRIVVEQREQILTVIVVRVGHRKQIYDF